jgi:hypothetical protein
MPRTLWARNATIETNTSSTLISFMNIIGSSFYIIQLTLSFFYFKRPKVEKYKQTNVMGCCVM